MRWPSSLCVGAYSQGVDVGRAYSGVDQYEDSAWHRVLWTGYTDRNRLPLDGEGHDEAGIF